MNKRFRWDNNAVFRYFVTTWACTNRTCKLVAMQQWVFCFDPLTRSRINCHFISCMRLFLPANNAQIVYLFFQPFLSAKNKKTEMQTERPFSRSQMHFFLNWLRLPRLIFSLPWNQFVFFFLQTHLGQCLTALASPIFRFSSYRSFFFVLSPLSWG